MKFQAVAARTAPPTRDMCDLLFLLRHSGYPALDPAFKAALEPYRAANSSWCQKYFDGFLKSDDTGSLVFGHARDMYYVLVNPENKGLYLAPKNFGDDASDRDVITQLAKAIVEVYKSLGDLSKLFTFSPEDKKRLQTRPHRASCLAMSESKSITPDPDVFSRILSHVSDSKTLYNVLNAFPKLHPLFFVALRRLCELPVYLDTFDPRSATASNQILDHLLSSSQNLPDFPRIAESIRRLVVRVEHNKYYRPPSLEPEPQVEEEEEQDAQQVADDEEHEVYTSETEDSEPEEDVDVVAFHERLPDLFKKTQNLESLDYHNVPGLALSEGGIISLVACERLRTVGVDCAVRETSWGAWKPFEDHELWDIEPFLKSLGPTITSLDLRHVCQTMLLSLASYGDEFVTCERLATLRMDITEGVWDWDGRGSPQRGATADYVFPSLGLPAVSCFELVVADRTISKPRTGPLDLVDCSLLCELSLDIRRINSYEEVDTINLFDGLSPAAFPALRHLEIKDYSDTANRRRLV
ncbi:hypothetical protein B0H16DRAFT_1889654 [Mycena metata]|uniref:Uncharacterized protein n=1 Tax=Mycena metata TaxID=1033252 RepID=A0AAD7IJ45_9AGAR|nr:hypothetical protein B0H16DRAFT_1889654 [Mycena metata]